MKTYLSILIFFLCGSSLLAQINSIASGNWNNPGVWQGGQVPGPADNVIINAHSINLNVEAEVNNLTFNNATFNGASNLTINGEFVWNGGSINGTGTVFVNGPAQLIGNQKNISQKTIRLQGSSIWNSGDIQGISNGILVVWGSGALTIDVPANQTLSLISNGAAHLHNFGELIKTGTGTFSHGFNTFFLNLSTGNLDIQQGIWNAGWHTELYNTVQIAENAELRNTNAMWLRGATITGDGYLVNTSSLRSTAVLSEVNNLKLESGSISNETDNNLEIINVMENFIWTAGTLFGSQGQLNVYGHALLTSANTKTISRQLSINGSGKWDNGIIVAQSTGNVLSVVGEFEIHAAEDVNLSFQGIGGQFRNYGVINKTGAGNVNFGFQTGSIHHTGSVLNIEQGNYSHSAFCLFEGTTINISANANFRNSGTSGANTSVDLSGAIIQGEGWFEIESGNLKLTTNTSSISKLRFISGNIYNVNSTQTCHLSILDQFIWQAGWIYDSGHINVYGHALLTSANTKTISRQLSINGSGKWDNGIIVAQSTGNVLSVVGEFEIHAAEDVNLSFQGIGGQFRNYGVINKTGAGNVNFGFQTGSIHHTGSVLNIEQGNYSHSAFCLFEGTTINISANANFRNSGTSGANTSVDLSGAIIQGEGWFEIESGNLKLTTNTSSISKLRFISGNIYNVNSTQTCHLSILDQFIWQAGWIYDSGHINVYGHAHFTGSGNKEISNGRYVRIEGTALWNGGLLIKPSANCGITVTATGEFEIAAPQNQTLTAQGSSFAGGNWLNYGLVKITGPGTFTSGFRNHFFNHGTLAGIGTYNFTWYLENNGFVEPGLSIGELNITGLAFPFSNNGGLNVELFDDSGPGVGHDRVIFSGTVALNGTLTATELASMPNGSYTILTCNGGANCRTGTFTFTDLPDCYTVQYTGNSVILVKDDTDPPAITGCPDDVTLNTDLGECYAVFNVGDPQASDNCNLVSFEGNMPPLNRFPVGVTEVTFIATDGGGQTASCYFVVTVVDNEVPSISNCQANYAVNVPQGECTAVVNWPVPTATDNCELVSFTADMQNGQSHPVGSFSVSYTATDDKGLTSTCVIAVTVIDNQAPVISNCPQNINISTDQGECDATVSWTEPTATDNCGLLSFSGNGNNGGVYPITVTTVTYTATDVNGNTSICTFTITISDQEAPVITDCPSDITVNAAINQCSATVTWSAPSASDNCLLASFSPNINNGSTLAVGSYQIVYTATDGGGLISTCSFSITILDMQVPNIMNCPVNIEVPTDFGQCTAIVSWNEPLAGDNCSILSFSGNGNNGGAYSIGTTTVTYTAVDVNNNQSTCSFTITVNNEFEILCPSSFEVCIDAGISVLPDANPSGGNYSGPGVSNGSFDPLAAGIGTHTILYQLQIGDCVSNCSFTVTVHALPVLTCPDQVEVCIATPAFSMMYVDPSGGMYTGSGVDDNLFEASDAGIGSHTINYQYIDDNGCEASCAFIINVYDQTLYYADQDGDGFGDPNTTLLACEQPEGYVTNNLDNCPNDVSKTDPGQCGCGISDTDSDGDGVADCNDECPNDPTKIAPGECGCGVSDLDSDGDGVADCNDECPNDPLKTVPGTCGCGVSDVDSDGDGSPDCIDLCPNDPLKTVPGICGCGVSDMDTDGDGTPDCNDGCPNDPNKIAPGQCGCGISDTDTDGDGVADCNDECPNDPTLTIAPTWYADLDGDGYGDPNNTIQACIKPAGYVSNNLDCNDNDPEINPNGIEICDGQDNNCNGVTDEGCERIGVFGNNVKIENGSDSPLAFNGSYIGTVAPNVVRNQTYEIRNVGGDVLSLTGNPIVTLDNDGHSYLEIISQPALSVLQPGESTTFTVSYQSAAAGYHTGTITIENDDPFNETYSFAIGAAVSGPVMLVRGNAMNILNGDNTASMSDFTDFGTINYNTSRTRSFEVRNNGTTNLLLTGNPRVVITGDDAAYFDVSSQPQATVTPGQGRPFSVRFTGSAVGVFNAIVSIENNDPGASLYYFHVQATVLPPDMRVTGNNIVIQNGDFEPQTQDLTDFGTINVGANRIHSFYVRNNGPGLLALTGNPRVVLTGADASQFTVTSQPVANLTSGNNSLLRIRYNPTSAGMHEALVNISSNDPNAPNYQFSVRGATIMPLIAPGHNANQHTTLSALEDYTWKIYPNPAANTLNIELNDWKESMSFIIYNVDGKIVKTLKIDHRMQAVDITDLDNGIYIIRSLNGSITLHYKFIKVE